MSGSDIDQRRESGVENGTGSICSVYAKLPEKGMAAAFCACPTFDGPPHLMLSVTHSSFHVE